MIVILQDKQKDKEAKNTHRAHKSEKRKEEGSVVAPITELLINTMVSSASCAKMVWQ